MKNFKSLIADKPNWIWIISIVSLFLCVLSYTEGDVSYASEKLSFWATLATNMILFSGLFEVWLIVAILFSYIYEKSYNINSVLYRSVNIIREMTIYTGIMLLVIFVSTLIAYFYASLINNMQLDFRNLWSPLDMYQNISPIATILVMSVLLFMRTVFYGLVLIAVGLLIKQKKYYAFIIIFLGWLYIGLGGLEELIQINIFPYQYTDAQTLSIISGNSGGSIYPPISLISSIIYFIGINIAAFLLLLLAVKYSKKRVQNNGLSHSMQEFGFIHIFERFNFWFYVIIIASIVPFVYFSIWIPSQMGELDNSYKLFTETFASISFLNFILPFLSVIAAGFTMWEKVHAATDTKMFSGSLYIQSIFKSTSAAGIGAVLGMLSAMGISMLIIPGVAGWDWEFISFYLIRLFITASIFAGIGFGILSITKSKVAAMALPVLYTNYALGGIYHIAGTKNIQMLWNILPKIDSNVYRTGVFSGWQNIISAAIVAIILLCIGYWKLKKRMVTK